MCKDIFRLVFMTVVYWKVNSGEDSSRRLSKEEPRRGSSKEDSREGQVKKTPVEGCVKKTDQSSPQGRHCITSIA
jgi:hypothetical protein